MMNTYAKLKTPSGTDCEVLEVPAGDGRRWHVKVRAGSFYVWAARALPPDASEGRIWRGVLRGVERELTGGGFMQAKDYDSALLPDDFDE